jgi:hypothetical protein
VSFAARRGAARIMAESTGSLVFGASRRGAAVPRA